MAESIAIRPLARFQDKVAALVAALASCEKDPSREAVHGLRTIGRRLQALLALCELLPGLPVNERQIRKVREGLKRIRCASGEVSDLDVQLRFVDLEQTSSTSGSESVDPRFEDHSEKLHRHLRSVRRECALKLARLLRKEGPRLCKSLQKLQSFPDQTYSLTESRLCEQVGRWFKARVKKIAHTESTVNHGFREHSRTSLLAAAHFKVHDETLHQLRKAAKLSSLMTEGAPVSNCPLSAMHEEFRSLQKAGGEWHDRLLLKHRATRHLGKRHALARRYAEEADLQRRLFCVKLAQVRIIQ